MREAHGGKCPAPAWMPQTDAEEKQDLAEAQSITCDRSLHLLLTNYQHRVQFATGRAAQMLGEG